MLEVGRITRPQGLRGEVVVQLVTSERDRLEPGSVLDADGRPLVVVRSRPHQRNFVVSFDGVATREDAEQLRGALLRAEPVTDDDALWVHELIGATVVDTAGHELGVVAAVQANPASDLLVLDSGSLVPLTFVQGWEVRGQRLVVDPPAGLLDL